MPARLSPHQLRDQLATADLIDVRTPAEFRAVHIDGARSHPLDQFDADHVAGDRPDHAAGPTLVLCKGGGRATQAAQQLRAAGHEAVVVEGGTDACLAAGLPCVRGKQTMSLERQVRIAAGSLVFLGTVLGVTLSPWLFILPGFVGAGLVFSGLSNTCGMGTLLARMPWNR